MDASVSPSNRQDSCTSQFLEPNVLTLLSDRQKGLIDGVENVFPNSPHGYCLRHLEANFHKQFKHPQLKSLLWQAACTTTEATFNEALTNMSKIDECSVDWLLQHADPKH